MKMRIFQKIFLFFLTISLSIFEIGHANNGIFYHLSSPPFGNGMFSVFTMVLGVLDYYDKGECSGVKINFKNQGVYYDSKHGSNWWRYFFAPVRVGHSTGATVRETTYDEQNYFAGVCEFALSRERAHHLIKKYVKVRSHIKNKVKKFKKKNFGNDYIIGVHYRGTDKFTEAPKVAYEAVKNKIQEVINAIGDRKYKIFIATDEQAFLDYIRTQFNNVRFRKSSLRSKNGQSIHHQFSKNYKKGEDAIIDCLLLSKCNFLIRTSSNLSLCATFFNPSLPVHSLNSRHGMAQ